MKKYVVLEIQCQKKLKLLDVYFALKSIVSYKGNLFAFQNLNFEKLNKESYDIYKKLHLCKYEYKIVLEHLVNTPYYTPNQHDRQMISNLDSCWNWNNVNINESLTDDDFKNLITFCDSLKALDVLTCILGFDQIEWGGVPVAKGTYGFEKADCTYGLGKNYLSNSLIIGRTHENKPYKAFLSCESRFRDLKVIDRVVALLGKIKHEEIYYAPENEKERNEWIEKATVAKSKFENALLGLQSINLEKIKKTDSMDLINKKFDINNYIKNFLCTDGWAERPARSYEHPSIICKNKDDREIAFSILSRHNGQHLQILIYYHSNEFLFSENLHKLHVWSTYNHDIEIFFRNMIQVRDYFYDCL